MSTITTPAHLPLNDADTEANNRYTLTDVLPGVLMVETQHSVYTVVIHGSDVDGYQVATVVCPAHPITGASMAVLHGVSCRVLGDRLVVVDGRTTMLRTSDIITTHVVA
jgi:hypothetical protein